MNRQEYLELFAKHLRRAKYIHGDWAIWKTGDNLDWSYSNCPFRLCGMLYKAYTHNEDMFHLATEYFNYYWSARLNKQMIRVWKRVFGQKRIEDYDNFSSALKWRG